MKLSSTKNISKKIGLPPGSLIHVGNHVSETPSISVLKYSADHISEHAAASASECISYIEPGYMTWINITGLSDVDSIAQIGSSFGMHPLILEDILNTHHMPKLHDFSKHILVIFKILNCNESKNAIEKEQLSILFGDGFVISFLERKSPLLDSVADRIRNPNSRIRSLESDYLVYSIIDIVVDNYFAIVENFGDSIEAIEQEIFEGAGNSILNEIHNLKRDMIFLRKSLWPLREILASLQRVDSTFVHGPTLMYFNDIHDHIIQILETTDSLKDILSGMTELFISLSGNRMNEIMKVLTIISTIFIPLTFITGLYGMNFKHMPELDAAWFYPWFLYPAMVSMVFGMIYFFRRKDWF